MACNIIPKTGKSVKIVQNGMFYILRSCYQETNRSSSSGQSNNQSQNATYGAPEYFEYNEHSFYDIHIDTEKYRLPRPSSKTSKADKK